MSWFKRKSVITPFVEPDLTEAGLDRWNSDPRLFGAVTRLALGEGYESARTMLGDMTPEGRDIVHAKLSKTLDGLDARGARGAWSNGPRVVRNRPDLHLVQMPGGAYVDRGPAWEAEAAAEQARMTTLANERESRRLEREAMAREQEESKRASEQEFRRVMPEHLRRLLDPKPEP